MESKASSRYNLRELTVGFRNAHVGPEQGIGMLWSDATAVGSSTVRSSGLDSLTIDAVSGRRCGQHGGQPVPEVMLSARGVD